MASSSGTKKQIGLLANALKRKDSFIQFFAMGGILLLSMRSLGQKYRLHSLQEDNYDLREEHEKLTEKMKNIKRSLLDEAALDSTGGRENRGIGGELSSEIARKRIKQTRIY
ncbi:hypothetical protein MKW98_004554 [Papaver atlanticum]|uniref:Uncharacterized protein n=1 Tax=Papaver atlanticum TaxID=357466 RepID=A0AAD4XIH6_9MAGN|nr:hypothetical protein MKW98_004554 [Papaver atlanticum]